MKKSSKWLIRFAAIYALAGAMLGSHMAGSGGDYHLSVVHAHILVVGWLTTFAYGLFYRVFPEPGKLRLARWQAWSALVGGATMPIGMFFYSQYPNPLSTALFIVTASILLLAMILFLWLVFFDRKLFD